MIVSGSIAKEGLSKCKVDPCGVFHLRVNASSVLCVQCRKWIHGRCIGMKRVTTKFNKHYLQKMLGEYWRGSGAGTKVI